MFITGDISSTGNSCVLHTPVEIQIISVLMLLNHSSDYKLASAKTNKVYGDKEHGGSDALSVVPGLSQGLRTRIRSVAVITGDVYMTTRTVIPHG